MAAFTTKPLNKSTWPDFARLVEKHNGVWGGCWCIGFHMNVNAKGRTYEMNRKEKEARVQAGTTHSAIVYDGKQAVGWCQFGPTDELPRIKLKKEYSTKVTDEPDWRITCFFIDKDYRGQGVAAAALEGAVQEIAKLGGGVVESYPQDTAGGRTAGAFLYNSTLSMFERQGFRKAHKLGKNHWVVRKTVRAAKSRK